MPRKRSGMIKCLACCASRQVCSDDENDFTYIGPLEPTPAQVEEVPAGGAKVDEANPPVSTGSTPEKTVTPAKAAAVTPAKAAEVDATEPKLMADKPKKVSIGTRESRCAGDVYSSDDEEAANIRSRKVVHFAICHEPYLKDTRDKYRQTPIKEKPASQIFAQEYFFMHEQAEDTIVRVPLSELKRFVSQYVRSIVDNAYASVLEEDFGVDYRDIIKNADVMKGEDDNTSMSTDDGIDLSSEESEAISSMVDDMLCDLTKCNKTPSPAEEAPEDDIPAAPQASPAMKQPQEGSSSDISTMTSDSVRQVESMSSLDWDGYIPLLREDQSYTDVTATANNCPQVSAGNTDLC